MTFYHSVDKSIKINLHQQTACLPGRLSPSFERKEKSNAFLILACFSWPIFNNALIYLLLQGADRILLMGESTNKYARFDTFMLSFSILPSFLSRCIVSLKQPAAAFFNQSFDIAHNTTPYRVTIGRAEL